MNLQRSAPDNILDLLSLSSGSSVTNEQEFMLGVAKKLLPDACVEARNSVLLFSFFQAVPDALRRDEDFVLGLLHVMRKGAKHNQDAEAFVINTFLGLVLTGNPLENDVDFMLRLLEEYKGARHSDSHFFPLFQTILCYAAESTKGSARTKTFWLAALEKITDENLPGGPPMWCMHLLVDFYDDIDVMRGVLQKTRPEQVVAVVAQHAGDTVKGNRACIQEAVRKVKTLRTKQPEETVKSWIDALRAVVSTDLKKDAALWN
ncbi:unnamed protein product [Amoebophrya sp. A25]|nr:unnamed protein product [Amoebophrya sp. A25]|eukprot:GSA25T00008539001.1